MSREGRYVATVGVITVFRNANSLAFRRYHAFASGEGRMIVATMSQPSMARSGQWTEPLALIRALPNCWQCYFRLRPSGQCFALLKIVPDDFLFAAIYGAHPLGQCFALLKIVPDDFFFKKQRLY
ncbi:MAG: hypothetical protein KJ556_19955 [Gammaproteobacteria bacterium]|nr:hypothetical protein [Gammaproteobacteria bacterium]MBU2058659.1 hypothetical protein [Gammaproteobacteria bacterium]MBU2177375.1 hypothetical protein [Gammaproteobacteria bacterium]MBU2246083.1 hypothetical protein [Gammaproteobacteria bacterium]MBU2344535.1 hypothetical protein [Gammaproteobacteria bacterium]